MDLNVHVFIHQSMSLEAKIDALAAQLAVVLKKEDLLMASIDDVAADVTGETTLIASVAAFTKGIQDQLTQALSGVNIPPAVQTKIDAVLGGLEANKVALALIANTPAAAVPVT